MSCPGELVPPATLLPLHADGASIRDALGRAVLLRGVNLSGMENGPTGVFQDEHFKALSSFGFNSVRLALGWAGVEPQKGKIDEGYLADVDRLVDLAEKHSVFVVIDLHQWYWSLAGMPAWTCPLDPALGNDYVQGCSALFFASDELKGAFAAVWAMLAARYKGRAAVAAFDLINEPPPPSMDAIVSGTFEKETLPGFYSLLLDAIRDVDPDRMVIVEPSVVSLGGTMLEPLPFANLAYSPHIYVLHGYYEDVGLVWLMEPNQDFVKAEYDFAMESAARLGMPLVIGEFGMIPGKDGGAGWLTCSGQIQDRHLLGSFYWDLTGGGWGILDPALNPRPYFVEHLSRPYVSAAAGEVVQMVSEPWSGRLSARLRVVEADACGVTEVVLPPILYPSGPKIDVSDNARVLYDPSRQRLFVQAMVRDGVVEIEVR